MRKTLKPSDNTIFSEEFAGDVLGVPGRFGRRILDRANGIFVNQRFIASRPFKEQGYKAGSQIYVEIRFDDECRNGYQSFAITGHVIEPRARDWAMGGCIHDEIAKYFPELAPLIKWHLCDTNGPMHYVANAAYLASNLDHNGRAAGEACAWDRTIKFGQFPITRKIGKRFSEWLIAVREFNAATLKTNPDRKPWPPVPVAVAHEKKPGDSYDFGDKWTFEGYECKWHECPFDSATEAQQFSEALAQYPFEIVMIPTAYSKGKARDLDGARRAANWPDATDEQLTVPRAELEAALLARLPPLVAAFRADMDKIGMLWREAGDTEAADTEGGK